VSSLSLPISFPSSVYHALPFPLSLSPPLPLLCVALHCGVLRRGAVFAIHLRQTPLEKSLVERFGPTREVELRPIEIVPAPFILSEKLVVLTHKELERQPANRVPAEKLRATSGLVFEAPQFTVNLSKSDLQGYLAYKNALAPRSVGRCVLESVQEGLTHARFSQTSGTELRARRGRIRSVLLNNGFLYRGTSLIRTRPSP